MNLFPALTTPLLFIFLSTLFNADDVALVSNLSKTSSANGTARSNNAFLSIFYLTFYHEKTSDWMVLESLRLNILYPSGYC